MKKYDRLTLNFLCVLLCVIYKVLLATNVVTTSSIVIYIVILMFFGFALLSIIKKNIFKDDLFKFAVLILLGGYTIIKIESVNYIFPVIIALIYYDKANKSQSIKKLINDFFVCLVYCFCFVIILNFFNIIPSHDLIRFKGSKIIVRRSLGFSHPAFVGLYFTFIMFSFFANHNINNKRLIFFLILSIIIYKITDSRTTLICNLIFLIFLIFKDNNIFKKILQNISPYIFLTLTLFTLLSVRLYINYNMSFLDEIFSGRLSIYNDIIVNNQILYMPFGSKKIEGIILDNYYLTVFLYFGYVGFFLWTLFYYKSQKKLKNDVVLTIIQLCIMIYGITDSNVIVSSINFMLSIQFLTLIYNVSMKERRKKINYVWKNKYSHTIL